MPITDSNKVSYGLSNVHYGSITINDGEVTFGAPTAYPGAVSLTLDPQGESSPFYADNIVYYTTSSNSGYDGELEMAYLPDDFAQSYLSEKESQEGMLVEVSEANPVAFYLMYQFEGDVKATKHILYNVLASRPSIEASTKEDTTEPNTVTIPITATPIVTDFGNIVKAKVPQSASNYSTFFTTAPTVPTAPIE